MTTISYSRRGPPGSPRRPWLTLYIGGQLTPQYGLVDSGADRSVVPLDIARRIGVQYDDKTERTGRGAGGGTFKYFASTNQLAMQSDAGGLTLDRPYVANQAFFILGRIDFFQRYLITFDQRQMFMDIVPYDVDAARN